MVKKWYLLNEELNKTDISKEVILWLVMSLTKIEKIVKDKLKIIKN
jgi:hypothetical protein